MLGAPPELWQPIWLTLRLAFLTTVALFIIGMPLAHWLNVSRWRGVLIVETVVTLPIVLPPTVIGFYLLVLFAPQNPLGKLWIALTGHTLAFSFSGLLVFDHLQSPICRATFSGRSQGGSTYVN